MPAGILEQGVYIESLNMSRRFTTYESNVLFALRFMIDHEVVGGNWVELAAGHHTYQGPTSSNKLSHCQMEAHIHCSKVISHKPEGMVQCPMIVQMQCTGRRTNAGSISSRLPPCRD